MFNKLYKDPPFKLLNEKYDITSNVYREPKKKPKIHLGKKSDEKLKKPPKAPAVPALFAFFTAFTP